MGYLVLGAVLLFAFIAWAPQQLQQAALALAWLGGALAVVAAVVGGITG
jgi:hypothetical protein